MKRVSNNINLFNSESSNYDEMMNIAMLISMYRYLHVFLDLGSSYLLFSKFPFAKYTI